MRTLTLHTHPRAFHDKDEFAIACYLALAGFMSVVMTAAMYLYALGQ